MAPSPASGQSNRISRAFPAVSSHEARGGAEIAEMAWPESTAEDTEKPYLCGLCALCGSPFFLLRVLRASA